MTLTDETMDFFNANTPHVSSSEDTVKVYALHSVSPYSILKVYTQMGGSPIDNV